MMMRFLPVIAFLLFISCNNSTKDKYVIKTMQYRIGKDGNILKTSEELIMEEYYNKGLLQQRKYFDSTDENKQVIKIFDFATNGKDSSYTFNISKTLSTKSIIRRDKYGNVVSIMTYDLPGPSDTFNFVYDNLLSADSLALSSRILLNGVLAPINNLIENTYDLEKRMVQQKTFTAKDSSKIFEKRTQWIYNKQGQNVEISDSIPGQAFTSKTSYEFNSIGNLLRESYTENKVLIYEITYSYSKSRKKDAIRKYPLTGLEFYMKFIYE